MQRYFRLAGGRVEDEVERAIERGPLLSDDGAPGRTHPSEPNDRTAYSGASGPSADAGGGSSGIDGGAGGIRASSLAPGAS